MDGLFDLCSFFKKVLDNTIKNMMGLISEKLVFTAIIAFLLGWDCGVVVSSLTAKALVRIPSGAFPSGVCMFLHGFLQAFLDSSQNQIDHLNKSLGVRMMFGPSNELFSSLMGQAPAAL